MIMNLLKNLRKALFENAGMKILSLAMATLTWAMVVTINNPVTKYPYTQIPVSIENADLMKNQGKAFELSESSKSITVDVEASRTVLNELDRQDFKASINMENLDGNKVPIDVKAVKYADKIVSIKPQKKYANVIIENLAEKQFKIGVETTGTPVEGYAVGTTNLSTNIVRVSGPESVVSIIDKAVVRVNVSNMTGEIFVETAPILLIDRNGSLVDVTSLSMSIESTRATVDMWEIRNVPINVGYTGNSAQGYAPTGAVISSRSSVEIKGESAVLNTVKAITIPSSVVDIEGATGTVSVEADISRYLPSGIHLVDTTDTITEITVIIEKLETAILNVPVGNLVMLNVPEGYRASFYDVDGYVNITVQGLKEDVEQLDASQINGAVDLDTLLKMLGTTTPLTGVYEAVAVFAIPDNIQQVSANVTARVLLSYEAGQSDISANEVSGNTISGPSARDFEISLEAGEAAAP